MRMLHEKELKSEGENVLKSQNYNSQNTLKVDLGKQKIFIINKRASINDNLTKSKDSLIRGRSLVS